ncbi:MAG: hypothetical protein K0S09_1466 [Sphingobacteriaceae bacterium]|jgi:hypothetical protein|nr:hypothetical protein [Sphingobacteriaceae bacterium]
MIKPLLLTLFLLLSFSSFAQRETEDFQLSAPAAKTAASLYNTMSYLDSRGDTSNLGIVTKNILYGRVYVINKIPMKVQVLNLFNQLLDNSAGAGELLFQLRQFNFVASSHGEKGFFQLRAGIYSKTGREYRQVAFIDTIALLKGFEGIKALFNYGSTLTTDFIASTLKKVPEASSQPFSYDEVVNIANIEKQRLPLYSSHGFTEGIYSNYNSFKMQVPDKKVIEGPEDGNGIVKTVNEKGKVVWVAPKQIYAVVRKGKPFINTGFGFSPLTRSGTDLLFKGHVEAAPKALDVLATGALFGLMGVLTMGTPTDTYEMKLDHLTGGFIYQRVLGK